MTMSNGLLTPPVGPGDHAIGPESAPVVLVEYGDFECPHCGAAAPIVDSVVSRLGSRIRFVYRHFPLTQAHPHAGTAAEAAEAAGAQGRFWEMHHMLFAHQNALDDPQLVLYAETIGLDAARFLQELLSHVHAPKVQADFKSGLRSGVNGTPTFFINGVRYDGPWHDEELFLGVLVDAASSVALP
jgi:protein-disulfide isomerase